MVANGGPGAPVARLHEVLHLAVLLDELSEFAPLLLEGGLLLLGLGLERSHLVERRVAALVRTVGHLDDARHLLLLFCELLFELAIDLVEHQPLATQVVDSVAQAAVVRQRLVVLDERLVEPILEDFDLLLNLLVVLTRSVDAAHLLALLDDARLRALDLLVQLGHPALLQLDLFVGRRERVRKPREHTGDASRKEQRGQGRAAWAGDTAQHRASCARSCVAVAWRAFEPARERGVRVCVRVRVRVRAGQRPRVSPCA